MSIWISYLRRNFYLTNQYTFKYKFSFTLKFKFNYNLHRKIPISFELENLCLNIKIWKFAPEDLYLPLFFNNWNYRKKIEFEFLWKNSRFIVSKFLFLFDFRSIFCSVILPDLLETFDGFCSTLWTRDSNSLNLDLYRRRILIGSFHPGFHELFAFYNFRLLFLEDSFLPVRREVSVILLNLTWFQRKHHRCWLTFQFFASWFRHLSQQEI